MTTVSNPVPAGSSGEYTSESIQVLEGLEGIRKRPGMYVGGTGLNALHHLVYECVDNAIDEAMAGYATKVAIRLGIDGSCTVIDDGRGIPIGPMKHENPTIDGRPAVEVILTELHAGGKFDDNAYKVSGGLHGVGVKCVNALSEWTEVEVVKDGQVHLITFQRGEIDKPLHAIAARPEATDDNPRKTGTKITFKPDPDIFTDTEFRFETLQQRIRELAYLNAGATIRLIDERVDKDGQIRDETFHFEDGLQGYVAYLNRNKHTVSPLIRVISEDADTGISVDIALQYTDATSELLLAFGNNIINPDGGTHVAGFKSSLTRTINNYAKRNNVIKDLTPSGDDLREGMTAVLSIKLPEPQFNNQTKEKLLNPEAETFVSGAITDQLGTWLEEHPAEAKQLCLKAVLAAQAREAARKAREAIKRKGALEGGGMPHKLHDCVTKNVDESEVFLVEGASAAGPAKGGRDHRTQAILPLRGKILNAEKARLDKVLGFEEIRLLIQVLQCGIGEDFDISKLRYGRVIIMTDADVDGSHIRTLILTFFFRHMTELFRAGCVFIAQPPLYQLTRNKKSQYVLDEKKLSEVLSTLALDTAVLTLQDAEGNEQRRIEGRELEHLIQRIKRLEDLIAVAERRGTPFDVLLEERANDPNETNRLPRYRVSWLHGSVVCWDESELKQAIESNTLILDDLGTANGDADRDRIATLRELHENREIDTILAELAQLGIQPSDYTLVQKERVTGEKEPSRFVWVVEPGTDKETRFDAQNISAILSVLYEVGRRGIEVKRFKGLGEMNADQLWETTMDPDRRTIVQVTLESAAEADALFSTLMGENVEPRRAYIEDHALEVKNLDV